MPYAKIPEAIGSDMSESQIRQALQKGGNFHQVAHMKLPISEANQIARLGWA
jgi:hypothetical protein